MSIFKTRTPDYEGQDPDRPRLRTPGLTDWLASLLRTPTPEYEKKPAPSTRKTNQP